jgi:flagellar basal-body rod modification protein FlgD
MTISPIAPTSSSASSSLTGTGSTLPKQQLNQDDFLKLLTTQLTYQDPMNPMTDTQYISQMANFTSLEQMRSLTTDFEKYSSAQQISTSQYLLGSTVTVGPDGSQVTGTVSAVKTESGLPRLIVNGGSYDPATVTSVQLPATGTVSTQ